MRQRSPSQAVRGFFAGLTALLLTGPLPAQPAEVEKFYHLDAVGTVRTITDRNGVVLERLNYHPFGEDVTPPTTTNTRRFAGKERDRETAILGGLDYFGARYYFGRIARFTTVDPYLDHKGAVLDPQRWNRYAYGRNNPLRYVDPDGRDIFTQQEVFQTAGQYQRGEITFEQYQAHMRAIGNSGLLGVTLLVPGPEDLLALGIAGRWFAGTRAGAGVLRSVGAAVNRTLDILPTQLQSKFKHAADFGVSGSYNKEAAAQFEHALQRHVRDEATKPIQGTYRGQDVTHFFNPNTGLNVIRDKQGGFVSGWKLSDAQRRHVIDSGKLGGGG